MLHYPYNSWLQRSFNAILFFVPLAGLLIATIYNQIYLSLCHWNADRDKKIKHKLQFISALAQDRTSRTTKKTENISRNFTQLLKFRNTQPAVPFLFRCSNLVKSFKAIFFTNIKKLTPHSCWKTFLLVTTGYLFFI